MVNRCLNGWSDKEGVKLPPPHVLSICTGPSCPIAPPLAIFTLLSAPKPHPPTHLLIAICHIFLALPTPPPPLHPTLLPLLSPPSTSSPGTSQQSSGSSPIRLPLPSRDPRTQIPTRCGHLLSLFCFSEVANYLEAKFNLGSSSMVVADPFFFD